MSVIMCSLWRDDERRNINFRMAHLAYKQYHYPDLRCLWVVGDSSDGTEGILRDFAKGFDHITVLRHDSRITGEDMHSRLRRLSDTASTWFRNMDDAEYVMVHESDLISPPDVVGQFLAHAEAGRCPIAGWPVMADGDSHIFYDVWAYRYQGKRFGPNPPYLRTLPDTDVFTVDSFGSCWMAHAHDLRNFRMNGRAVLDICDHLRSLGRELWVDRTIVIEQPRDLWVERFSDI